MPSNTVISDLQTTPQTLENNDQLRVLSTGELQVEGSAVTVDSNSDNARVRVQSGGVIDGTVNAVNFENGGESSGRLVNFGQISSDSRAVNIGGENIAIINQGDILGTGDQRNGTIYADGSADQYLIANGRRGRIDAGQGNQGAGISLQTGETSGDTVQANIINSGVIQGRGQAEASSPLAGDGIRIYPGDGQATFQGQIRNQGEILSESTQGPTGAIRISDGLSFQGNITNGRRGTIAGVNNGLYVGNAEHNLTIRNSGQISSDSRAVNIDGSGVRLFNNGQILGTGNQRNGTIYSDATADNFLIQNSRRGLVDAGRGNQGAGIALQTGEVAGDVVQANILNSGVIQGRGQGGATTGLAGDGIRIFSGVAGESTVFEGNLVNTGLIRSESTQGPTGAVRLSDGLSFQGNIINGRRGQISGTNNGLYVGNADHDLTIQNSGLISSDSRAVNIDGTGVDLFNNGVILGTGNQRNGTVYADGTADDYSIVNGRRGVIDAGRNNQGAGISLQVGDQADDVVDFSIRNGGQIRGRGDAASDSSLAGDGIRLFSGVSEASVTAEGDIRNTGSITGTNSGITIANGLTLDGSIQNFGSITATDGTGIVIDGELTGDIFNRGRIQGTDAAIDARDSEAGVTVLNTGRLSGDVYLSESDDILNSANGITQGQLFGLDGDDQIIAGRGNDWISGGAGNDTLTGNSGSDIFVFGQNQPGADVITDFDTRRDRIDISALNLGASDVLNNAQQINGDVLLTLDQNQTVLLQDTSLGSLNTNDFIQ